MKSPRQLSLVRFDFDALPAEYHARYPFEKGHTYVFFGEIPNMPGHCVVADHQTGRVYSGYHTENFVELSEDEV
jgi:diadenosine tetraphosphate (Ap4A) HIT family hydrolase